MSQCTKGMYAMVERSGPFWDAMEGRAPMPPAAATLGLEFVDVDTGNQTLELAFVATEAFTNPAGNVLGAYLAAMLYDTVGPTLLATLPSDQFQSTIEFKVSFLRPTRPGRLLGRGRIVHRNGDLVYLDATLTKTDGVLLATATATARIIPLSEIAAAP
jgi:uncharacterized protein (TIGR00369 family)